MRPLALAAALLAVAPIARAQEVTIKLGTLAPNGSTWHSLLLEMGERWAEASQGRVKLRIYPGGHSTPLWQAQAPSWLALALTYRATGQTTPRPS